MFFTAAVFGWGRWAHDDVGFGAKDGFRRVADPIGDRVDRVRNSRVSCDLRQVQLQHGEFRVISEVIDDKNREVADCRVLKRFHRRTRKPTSAGFSECRCHRVGATSTMNLALTYGKSTRRWPTRLPAVTETVWSTNRPPRDMRYAVVLPPRRLVIVGEG